jgi:glucosamine--fructose-6-phosphate aminotransferase (isomerizing)
MTDPTPSRMRTEIDEIPRAAVRLGRPEAQGCLRACAESLRDAPPRLVVTVARGSSDHAATYLSYCLQIALGIPVASLGPSVASVYGAQLKVPGAVAFAISQSGSSADLTSATEMLIAGGARPLVLTNSRESRLAALGQPSLEIAAGPEQAIAATKSYVNTILAGLWLLAHWSGDRALASGLQAMPEALDRALAAPLGAVTDHIGDASDLTVTARGPALGLALEAALKLQEVLGRHATAYSGAEVMHGPITRMGEGYPILALGDPRDPGVGPALDRLGSQGARVLALADHVPPGPDHPFLAALPQIVHLYAALETRARQEGRDPDAPRFLKKETVTL